MSEFDENAWQDTSVSMEYLLPDDIETVYDDVLSSAPDMQEIDETLADEFSDTDFSVDSPPITDSTEDILSSESSTELSTESYVVVGEAETDPLAYWRSMNVALWLIVFILLVSFCYERIRNGLRSTRNLSKGK